MKKLRKEFSNLQAKKELSLKEKARLDALYETIYGEMN